MIEKMLVELERSSKEMNDVCNKINKKLFEIEVHFSKIYFGIPIYLKEMLPGYDFYLGYNKINNKWQLCIVDKFGIELPLMLQSRLIRLAAYKQIDKLIELALETSEKLIKEII